MPTQNKTVPTKASVPDFIGAIADPVRMADAQALVKLMKKVTGKPAIMWGNAIIGFGSYHYKYETGREGDSPLAAFSPRKAANVIYLQGGSKGLETVLAKLGKHTMKGVCLHIKKLSDVDTALLTELLTQSVAKVQASH